MSLKMSPLPRTPTEELLQAHESARESIAAVKRCERMLHNLRHEAKQRITRYENLVLEVQGQLAIPWEDSDGGG